VSAVFTAALSPCVLAGGGASGGLKPGSSQQQALDQLLKATPAERSALLGKVVDPKKDWHKVGRGDILVTLVERGALEAVSVADVVCRLKARTSGSPVAATIKWVVDDGTQVKKGQKLLELDSSELQERLKVQKIALARAEAALVKATEHLKSVT